MITLNQDQELAVKNATALPFVIITGGAGVGKTTIIKEIVQKTTGGNLLCCPTGKAAARLREASELPTSTIHSALGYNGISFRVKTLAGLRVIVDESSMLDSWLLAEIIKRKPAALTLIGDNAQLPPVGAGQPFHDLIALRQDITARLTICYRNSEAIYQAASAIRAGSQPQNGKTDGELFQMSNTGNVEDTIKRVSELITAGEIDFNQDIILCCKNETVEALNKAIVAQVNPREGEEKWKAGDRIICCKNFASSDVWNGTTGTITGIDADGRAWVRGDIKFHSAELDEYVEQIIWGKDILRECKHAYALTVHKSQGSQYRKVFFCTFGCDNWTINRALIYTAVTRARRECHILGQVSTMRNGISRVATKNTVLQELAKREHQAKP